MCSTKLILRLLLLIQRRNKGPCTPHNLPKNYFFLKTRPFLSVLEEGGVDDVTTIGTATTAAGAGYAAAEFLTSIGLKAHLRLLPSAPEDCMATVREANEDFTFGKNDHVRKSLYLLIIYVDKTLD